MVTFTVQKAEAAVWRQNLMPLSIALNDIQGVAQSSLNTVAIAEVVYV